MFDLTRPWPRGIARQTIIYALLVLLVALFALSFADAPVSLWGQDLPQPVRSFFEFITDFGLSDWILIPSFAFLVLCALLGRFIPNWTAKLALRQTGGLFGFIFAGVGLPGLASALLKRAIGRGRPQVFESAGALDFRYNFSDYAYQSFPSGHTTTAFAFALVIGFMSPRWLPAMLVVAVLVGLSRVVVGAHYPTDVLGGAVMGILGAYLVRNLFAARGWVFRKRADGAIVLRRPAAILRLVRGRRRPVQAAA